jgi:TonB family protein
MRNKMSHSKILIAAAGFIFSWTAHAIASDVKIVANPSVRTDSISSSELRGIFMAERNSLKDGSHVAPVFERSGATHEAFLREVLNESAESLQSHYGALVFTGKASMPRSFNSDAEVLTYVAKTRGAIGYVSVATSADGVKVLTIVPEGNILSRALLIRVEPEYPETLRQLRIGGTVRLQITVSPQGRAENVTLLGGNPILGESAIKAVTQWVYAPAPSRTTVEVTIPFDPR